MENYKDNGQPVTNNDRELPRRPMAWADIFELEEIRNQIRKQLKVLNKQIKFAKERNWKIDNSDI